MKIRGLLEYVYADQEGKGGTIPGVPKCPKNFLQYSCFRKTSGSDMVGANLLLAPGVS